jgi:hypothetical protein
MNPIRRHTGLPSRARQLAALAVITLASAGCARAVAVGSEPRPVYRIEVSNSLAEPMIVSYNDGRGDALLGTVAAGRTEQFVIATRTETITVHARNAAGTRTAGPFTVQLSTTSPQPVRIR